ncbi:MAG: CpaF family protein [Bdellovibrionaceae bacterium]|nr:CpaF family protein [Bdellovibrio sp.]
MQIDYGPLKTLLETEDITEVMVNSWNKVFVEHRGMLVETSVRFVDTRQLEELIYSLLSFDKKNINTARCFDGVLSSGYRYNITLPPMSPKGPTLTIRKFNVKNFLLEDLVKSNFITEKASHFLKAAIEGRLSIVISGGTGSGKTSFLNTLGSLISPDQRIVSIEDVAELKLNHPNWLALQSVREGPQPVSVRDCLINSLRMRPDRIIVGECRKDETFEMLQAMNTGHDGSMTTIHGNSPVDCLSRMESLVQFCGVDLPLKQVRYQMSQAIDLIIQIRRKANGQREISEIWELTGMSNDIISRSAIFERNKAGDLVATGYVPDVLAKINAERPILHSSFFEPKPAPKKTG